MWAAIAGFLQLLFLIEEVLFVHTQYSATEPVQL
jgi:hypothetical protein